MKRKLLIFAILLFPFGVFADECSSKERSELLKAANNLKVNYENTTEEGTRDDPTLGKIGYVNENILVNIYNISENIFLSITNDNDDKVISINYALTNNGKYVINDTEFQKIVNYTIKVYSHTDCEMYLIKTINFKKPRLNPNYYYSMCDNYHDLKVCSKLIDDDSVIKSEAELRAYLNNYDRLHNNKNNSNSEVSKNFIKKNYKYIIGAGSVIVLGIVIYIIISKRRSRI